MSRTHIWVAVAFALTVGGCATDEQTGQMLGAGSGAVLGGLVGNAIGGNTTSTLVGSGVGALGGYFIGGEIGRSLDERDQQLAAQATQQVLYQPYIPPEEPPASPTTAPSTTKPAHHHHKKPAAAAAAAPAAHWASDHSGAQGTVSVTAIQATPSGGECRTLHEIVYVGGKEETQDQQYCRSPGTQWQKA